MTVLQIDELNSGVLLGADAVQATQAVVPLKSISDDTTYPATVDSLLSSYDVYVDPHRYGAKGDALGLTGCTVTNDAGDSIITSPQYTFTQADVGKALWVIAGWKVNTPDLTIASVSGGAARIEHTLVPGTRSICFGTDDTLAIHAAMQAAATHAGITKMASNGTDPGGWGSLPYCGAVRLRNRGYLVRNPQSRFDDGYLGAISIPRNVALVGAGVGKTVIYCGSGNWGHVICNESAGRVNGAGSDEFVQCRSMTIQCNGMSQGDQGGNGVHYEVSMGGFSNVDAYSCFEDLFIMSARKDGLYIRGRGENIIRQIWSSYAFENAIHVDASQDTRIHLVNAVASRGCGFRLNGAASYQVSDCKGFYCGADSAGDYAAAANFAILDDGHGSYRKGAFKMDGCESQESVGSGIYMNTGFVQMSGILVSDPKRSSISSNHPDIAAHIHLDENASHNVLDVHCRAALGIDWTNHDHYGGDYAIYIADGAIGNQGHVYTPDTQVYDVAKLGGPGITNRTNTKLYVDAEPLPSDVPDKVTGLTGEIGLAGNYLVRWTEGDDGGRAIRYREAQYRLSTDTEWNRIGKPTTPTTAEADFTNPTINSEYDFRVRVGNINGTSEWSDVFTATVETTVAGAPTGLIVQRGGDTLYGRFTAPVVTGGEPITDYKIEYEVDTNPGVWATYADGTSTDTEFAMTGVTAGDTYQFRVSAVNAVGDSTPSAVAEQTPLASYNNLQSRNLLMNLDASIAGMVQHDAATSANQGKVTFWDDHSGRVAAGEGPRQNQASRRPEFGANTINGLDAITFDGSTTTISFNPTFNDLAAKDITMSFVVKPDSSVTTEDYVLISNNHDNFTLQARGTQNDWVYQHGTNSAEVNTAPTTGAHNVVIRKAGGHAELIVNGTQSATFEAEQLASDWIEFGRANVSYGHFGGEFGQVVIWEEYRTNDQVNAHAADMETKWGTSWTDLPASGVLALNPTVWLDPDDASTIQTVTGGVTINDKSGNTHHTTQGTSSARPALSAAAHNGKDVLTFDGGDSLSLPSALHTLPEGDNTVILVGRTTNLASGGSSGFRPVRGVVGGNTRYGVFVNYNQADRLQAIHDPSFSNIFEHDIPGSIDTELHLFGFIREGAVLTSLYDNDTATGTAANVTLTGLTLGSEWTGDIAEVIIFNRALNGLELGELKQYFNNKFSMKL